MRALLLDEQKMPEKPTILERIIFSIITCIFLYFLLDFAMTYAFQDSSPKQTVALLRIVILIFAGLVVNFSFFKITNNKFEDLGKMFINLKSVAHILLSIFFVLAIIGICSNEYKTYIDIELYNATQEFKKTLDSLPSSAGQRLKSLL